MRFRDTAGNGNRGKRHQCNQVEVRDVPVAWNETYILTVTYDPGACREIAPSPVPMCEILFRVVDSAGAPAPKAVLRLSAPTVAPLVADGFGRARIGSVRTAASVGSAEGTGHRQADFAFECLRTKPEREETSNPIGAPLVRVRGMAAALVSATDATLGDTVNYTYDLLNRLASAAATDNAWGNGYVYDGYGNLLQKTVTAGSAPSLSQTVNVGTNQIVGIPTTPMGTRPTCIWRGRGMCR